MSSNAYQRFAGVLLCLAGSMGFAAAQEPARSQGTPIIFSDPSPKKSSAISSNLTELRKPQAPFRNRESDLKGPLNIFRPGGSENEDALKRVVPTTPVLNKKSAKDLLNEQAEMMYLSPGGDGDKAGDDTLFGLDNNKSVDPYKKGPRNSLERYYDQMDRARGIATNQAAASSPFGSLDDTQPDKFGVNNKSDKGLRPGNSSKAERNPNSSALLPNSDDAMSGSAKLRDVSGIRSPKPLFGNATDHSSGRRTASEERMEDFKRLLEGSRYSGDTRDKALGPVDNYRNFNSPNSIYGGNTAARTPALPAATPTWSSTRSAKPDPQQEFVKSANLIGDPGKPEGLAALKAFPSLNEPPPQIQSAPAIKAPPTTTFKVPKRRF